MTSDKEKKKREIFEGMSVRRQQKILKKGYDKWDPFLEPKEPPFFRKEERNRITQAADLLDRFLQHQREKGASSESLDPVYVQGAKEICFGLLKGKDDRYKGMEDFCQWYSQVLKEEEEGPS